MTIHEEAALAYLDAAKDCSCHRCRDAGLEAVLRRLGVLLRDALRVDGHKDEQRPTDFPTLGRLLADMRNGP